MEKLKDAEILARLIYRAYIAPDPHAPLEAEALLPFQAALDLYARTWRADESKAAADRLGLTPFYFANGGNGACGDSCPVELPEDASESDTAAASDLDGFEPAPLRAHDTHTHTHTHTHRGGG